ATLVPAALVLAAALALQTRPTEYLVGGREPGVYVSTMALIARTGGLAYTDPGVLAIPAQDVELFYRNPAAPDFSWGRFMGVPLESPRSGRVFPEFFHLFPAFGAYLFQSMGVKGALATPPVFGVLGTLGAFFVLRRLFGDAAALLGGLLLGTNVGQVWCSAYPVSEPVSQFLLFLGLLAFALWEARGTAAFGVIAGFAWGLTFLVRIDSVLLLLPLGLYVLVRRAHGDLPVRRAVPLLLPLVLLLAHAGVHAAFFSRTSRLNAANRPYWSQPTWVWAALAILLVALAALVHAKGPTVVRLLEAHGEGLRAWVAGALTVLALYAYF